MTELRKILPHVVVETGSGQTVAAFATKAAAETWAEDISGRTGRTFEVKPG